MRLEEAEQSHTVLPDDEVGVQGDRIALPGARDNGGRAEDQIADPVDVEDDVVEAPVGDSAGQAGDHGATPRPRAPRNAGSGEREVGEPVACSASSEPRLSAWQRATASASAASAGVGGSERLRRACTMSAICS